MTEEKNFVLITTVITGAYQKSRSSGYAEKVTISVPRDRPILFKSGHVKHPDLQQIQCLEV